MWILIGFMSYVFMRALGWKTPICYSKNYGKYYLKFLLYDLETMENII
jgi:hypothetical protein